MKKTLTETFEEIHRQVVFGHIEMSDMIPHLTKAVREYNQEVLGEKVEINKDDRPEMILKYQGYNEAKKQVKENQEELLG